MFSRVASERKTERDDEVARATRTERDFGIFHGVHCYRIDREEFVVGWLRGAGDVEESRDMGKRKTVAPGPLPEDGQLLT